VLISGGRALRLSAELREREAMRPGGNTSGGTASTADAGADANMAEKPPGSTSCIGESEGGLRVVACLATAGTRDGRVLVATGAGERVRPRRGMIPRPVLRDRRLAAL
jgi:hypothetical protein